MLYAQQYLRSGKSLEDLRSEHGVKSHVQNKKIGLTYDQIEARESDPLAQQCRGLILRESTYDIVACPMFRFFNLEQKELASDLDWSTAAFENKLDGTLIIVYWDDLQGRWHAGTRSRPEANAAIDEHNLTFALLTDIAIEQMVKKGVIKDTVTKKIDLNWLMRPAIKTKTYCFELTSPFNRIVCQYDDPSLTLLAVRDNLTLKEECPSYTSDVLSVPIAEKFEFKNINHMIQVVRDWDPKEKEGIVVKDLRFNRIKVKNPAYLAYNHMRDSLSTSFKGCVEIVLLGKDDDVVGMMPNFIADRIKRIKPLVQEVLKRTQADYDELKNISEMKEFALAAQTKLWPAALFALKRNKTSDLHMFALGNTSDSTKIPGTATRAMLQLCKKVDPTLALSEEE
jgi:hypothetical protein